MAESILFCIAESLLGQLGSSAVQEIGLALWVKSDLDKLSQTLATIKAVLLDAERKQEKNHALQLWLERLKDVCFSSSDVLDEFEILALRQQVVIQRRSTAMKKVRLFFSSSNRIVFNLKMSHRIKKIRENLDDIAADKDKFHLSEQNLDKKVVPVWRQTYSKVDSFDVIGRDYDEKVIVDHLIMQFGDGKNVPVIPIVGLGGLGKTTLAKTVYNNARVIEHFNFRKWVCVSEDFDVKKIICDIVKCEESSLENMSEPLRQTLSDKRYLLVLDDVWNEDATKWEILINLLNCGANGSKIVVTTRSPLVASIMKPPYTHILEGLSDEDSLNLLMKHAFGEGQEKKYPHLEEFGKDIAKKCRGVPLAVRTLGSHLNMKTEASEWLSVRDSEVWNLEQVETDILPVLKLSYDYLPPNLKQCFAICSMFEKDHEYIDTSVIYLWMALGLIESDQNLEPEDIGKKYVTQLLSRSFFQDFSEFESEVVFKMHDLMHDLAISVTKSDCSRLSNDTPNVLVDPKVRHMSFYNKSLVSRDKIPKSILVARNLRMIRVGCDFLPRSGQCFVNTCILKFKFLRVLDMKTSSFEELPNSIGGLKHLRYLDLCIGMKLLPNALCKLQSLQYLRLKNAHQGFDKLPKNFGDLFSLRYLKVATNERCFPVKGIGSLTCLRTLIIHGCNNLEYLFDDDDYDRIGGMQGNLQKLRNLVIGSCPKLVCLPRSLRFLSKLETLRINYCEELELVKNDEIQEIGNLVSLRVLVVEKLPKLVAFPPWLPRGGVASTCLKELTIINCENFRKFPEDLRHLEKLTILRCPRLTSFSEGSNPLAPTLRELCVLFSPELKRRYELNERHKISHIAKLVI